MASIFPYLLFIKIILTHLLMFCSIKILTGCIIVGIYENLSIKPLQIKSACDKNYWPAKKISDQDFII